MSPAVVEVSNAVRLFCASIIVRLGWELGGRLWGAL